MTNLNGSILSGISNGLSSTYSILANAAGTNGLTLDSLLSTRNNPQYANTINQSFANYIQSNFSTMDKNKDGILSAAELSNMTNSINSTGVTQAQLAQMGASLGYSNEQVSEIMAHFSDIDTNGDGKVSVSEINAYNLTSARDKKEIEFKQKMAADMSIMYADDSSSKVDASSSMLSYKFLND